MINDECKCLKCGELIDTFDSFMFDDLCYKCDRKSIKLRRIKIFYYRIVEIFYRISSFYEMKKHYKKVE